jgi:hypothetical protein
VLIAAPPERSFAANLARDTAILDDLGNGILLSAAPHIDKLRKPASIIH